MTLQKLFLSEGLVTLVAEERLLIGVDEHVRLEVACRYRCVGTDVALVTLLTLVRLVVELRKLQEVLISITSRTKNSKQTVSS